MSELPLDLNSTEIITNSTSHEHIPDLDRIRLNELMQIANRPGVYFGKGLELTDYDREQFEFVASEVEAELAPKYEDPKWQAFVKLLEEGIAKGAIFSIDTHKGTKVPTWCIDGGEEQEIKKVRLSTEHGEKNGIQVPQEIFNLYHWRLTAQSLRGYITRSNESLSGTSPKELREILRHLAKFIKDTRNVNER